MLKFITDSWRSDGGLVLGLHLFRRWEIRIELLVLSVLSCMELQTINELSLITQQQNISSMKEPLFKTLNLKIKQWILKFYYGKCLEYQLTW